MTLLIFIVGLTLGFLIPRSPRVMTSQDSNQGNDQNKLKELGLKFQKISEEDIQEYLQLKEMKAKYEKADEIFGKILNIFLLDLGLRISGKQLEELKAQTHPSFENSQPVQPSPVQIEKIDPPKPETQERPKRMAISNHGNYSEEQVLKLLEEKKLENALNSWTAAKPLNREAFNLISGRFAGTISFSDATRNSLELEMELIGARFNNGVINGEFLLKTTDPSDPKYRDTTTYKPNSKISNFRLAEDGALLVEAMGGDGLFQLYYFSRTNSFQGSLYEKRGLENFKRTGNIWLSRR